MTTTVRWVPAGVWGVWGFGGGAEPMGEGEDFARSGRAFDGVAAGVDVRSGGYRGLAAGWGGLAREAIFDR